MRNSLNQCLAQLTPRSREVLLSRYSKQTNIAELAGNRARAFTLSIVFSKIARPGGQLREAPTRIARLPDAPHAVGVILTIYCIP